MPVPAETSPDRRRLDQDDHDVLTFGEAGERLRIEIAATENQIATLAEHGSAVELARAERRLDALRAAVRRNSAQPINDVESERFFGHAAKTRIRMPSPDG